MTAHRAALVESLVVMLVALTIAAVAALGYGRMAAGHAAASDRVDVTVVNDTRASVSVLGLAHGRGGWRSMPASDGAPGGVTSIDAAASRALLYEGEGFDSVAIVIRRSDGYGRLLLKPSNAAEDVVVSRLETEPRYDGPRRPWSLARLLLPVIGALVVAVIAVVRLRRRRGVRGLDVVTIVSTGAVVIAGGCELLRLAMF